LLLIEFGGRQALGDCGEFHGSVVVLVEPGCRVDGVAEGLEPFFLENAARWAAALRDAVADVVMTERAGPHGGAFWREEFPLMVAWAFGPSDP